MGIRNAEFGIRNAEYGNRNAEFGINGNAKFGINKARNAEDTLPPSRTKGVPSADGGG